MNQSTKVILEFTYKGRKHTFLRRIGIYGDVLTTTNVNSAKRLKQKHVKEAIRTLISKLGEENVRDIKVLEG